MLPKEHRFSRNFFSVVFRRGRRTKTPYGNIVSLPARAEQSARFAVVISKKILRKAVDRNRLRRQLYAQLREANIPANKKHQIYIIKPELLSLPPSKRLSFLLS